MQDLYRPLLRVWKQTFLLLSRSILLIQGLITLPSSYGPETRRIQHGNTSLQLTFTQHDLFCSFTTGPNISPHFNSDFSTGSSWYPPYVIKECTVPPSLFLCSLVYFASASSSAIFISFGNDVLVQYTVSRRRETGQFLLNIVLWISFSLFRESLSLLRSDRVWHVSDL